MGDKTKAEVSFKLAIQLSGTENSENLSKIKQDTVNYSLLEPKTKVELFKIPPKLAVAESKELPNASDLIELSKNENGKGRFVIAKSDIKTGDTVLIEPPYAACLIPKYYGTHCLECFTKLVSPIPCPDCAGVAFCTPECKDKACSTYHKYECKFINLMVGSGMSVLCHIALRVITQAGNKKEEFKNIQKFLDGLCRNSYLRKPEDYLQRCLMTSLLLRILQTSEFFGRRTSCGAEPTNEELDVGLLILGLLEALQFNAHEIYQTMIGEKHRFEGSKPVYIAVGIYKTGALFNHDCYPGVARYFSGKNLVLTATKPIERFAAVAENYGPIFTKKMLLERQRNLRSRYWFKCECNACVGNWPILDKMTNAAKFKCLTKGCKNVLWYPLDPEKKVKCSECRKNILLKNAVVELKRCEKIYRKAAEAMDVSLFLSIYLFSLCIFVF